MADSPILPQVGAWRDGSGRPMPAEFYRFLRDLASAVSQGGSNSAAIANLQAQIDALEVGTSITGPMSVQVIGGDGGYQLRLVNDDSAPGASSHYGTDASGSKGWFALALAALSDVDLAGLADGDGLVWDAAAQKWEAGSPATPQVFNRITADGDIRVTADGDLRITD